MVLALTILRENLKDLTKRIYKLTTVIKTMKIYNVIYKREILTELEFEVEAENEEEARQLAEEDFENLDWENINDNDHSWSIEKIEDLGEIEEIQETEKPEKDTLFLSDYEKKYNL